MAWYKSGTVSVTSGSPTVTGSGTSWVANVKAGHGFIGPDRFTYEILSVDSNTQLTLAEPYASASDSGEAYKIVPTQGIVQTLATAAQTLINDFAAVRDGAGQGVFGDGNVSTPGVRFAADVDCGFYRPAANSIGVVTAGTERLRVDSGGLLLVGSQLPYTIGTATANNIQSHSITGSSGVTLGSWNVGTAGTDLQAMKSRSGVVGAFSAVVAGDTLLQVLAAGDDGSSFRSATNILSQVDQSPSSGIVPGRMILQTADADGGLKDAVRLDSAQNVILKVNTSAPGLANSQMVFSLTTNTNLRVSVRGTDGVTRVANLALV